MDEGLVQDDGIDLTVAELDRCCEVTRDQDKASKIENTLYETQRDAKTERLLLHRPRGICPDTGLTFRLLDPAECRPATLGGSWCLIGRR